jgi:pyruvate formate lyase activating enzyme
MGYRVKLDTNGTNPGLLEKLLPMLDYVAMDIKAPEAGYRDATRMDVVMDDINRSISLIREKAKDYQFRTTVVPEFFRGDDAIEIGKWLKGSRKYVMQQLRLDMPVLDEGFIAKPYEKEQLEKFSEVLKNYFDEVEIVGI